MSDGERRLAAIMFTDMVGFTALTQSDEAQSLAVLDRHNRLLRPIFPQFRGREVKAMGDSFLVEFDSALDAVKCAVEVQRFLHDYNISTKDEWKIALRIGVHLGDVVHSGGDVFGDAVNIASRLQPLADPEGVCISEQVFDQVRNKVTETLVKLEPHDLKGVKFAVDVYRVAMPWEKTGISVAPIAVTAPAPDKNRVAVLPFRNMSPDPNDEYFAEGITEEIISTVSGISGLEVISRTSVMGYKGTTKKVEDIGKELKVGSVLEGSLRKAGNRIRVTTQLIDVAKDRHLWAQNYDRNLDDVFEVQSDVAKQVAEALRVKILPQEKGRIEKRPTESTAAYTLYLRGRQLWNKRTLNDVREALTYFERAAKEDPGFALGYLGLADCFLVLRNNFGVEYDPGQSKAKAMIEKAIELDPLLAEAQATMGALLEADYRFKDAEERYRKAIELKPNYAFAHMWYNNLLYDEGRLDEALVEIEKALELDPLSPVTNFNYGVYFWAKRDYPGALKAFERTAELAPDYDATYLLMSWVNGKLADFESVSINLAKWVRLAQKSYPKAEVHAKAISAVLKGDRETVKRLLPEIEGHLDAGMDAYSIARLYFSVGEFDRGFSWLERSFSRREYSLVNIKVDARLDGVRTDPRYLDLLKRLGLDQTPQTQ